MSIESRYDYIAACERLQAASAAYYSGAGIVMDDASYDQMWRDVEATEAAHPEWSTGGPVTGKVAGGAVSGDVPHSKPMLSLDNVFSADELGAWLNRVAAEVPGAKFMVEPKFDGLALSLIYDNGTLTQVLTRGDGATGEDVSYCITNISNVPVTGARWGDGTPFSGNLRGEAIFTHAQFEDANKLRAEHGDKPFVNARNGVAGAVRGSKDRLYNLPFRFICYGSADLDIPWDTDGMDYFDVMGAISRAGFTVSTRQSNVLTASDVTASVERWEQARHQANLDTDGCVIKVSSIEDRAKLGMTGRAPRWAVAYKFPAEEVMSTLEEVIWQVGRTGVITPRARITPVFVSGTTIEYATLHNPGDLARKGFLLGDKVMVKRAGEVIPRLEAPVTNLRTGAETPITPPDTCPRCGEPIDRSQERWRCQRGRQCGLAEAIAYAVSRDALDIDGLGKVQVSNLVESGAVNDLRDVFQLTTGDLISHGGVAPANAPKIATQIAKAADASPARVLTALGIRGTGRSLSRALARRFGTLSGVATATAEQLAEVDKIGPVKAALIRDELLELADVVDQLVALGIGETPDIPSGSAAGTNTQDNPTLVSPLPLAGKTVVVTGSMSGPLAGKSRNEVNELIESLGGKSSGSVSKNTHLLVVGQNAGSKLAKATELGVPVMTEDEFADVVAQAAR